MIKAVFTEILKLCLSASIVAVLVMVLRLVLKKAPRSIICALWALVAVRLLIPTLPESRISVVPEPVDRGSAVTALSERVVEDTVIIREAEPAYKEIVASYPNELPVYQADGESYVVVSRATQSPPKTFGETVLPVLAVVWAAGAGLMLLYMAFSSLRVRCRLRASVRLERSIWVCDDITTPFILGIVRPRIYLPSVLNEEERRCVLAHEQAHLKRGDQLWKPLGFFLLSLYWFNPLFWLAYVLLCRDIESACDEKVVKGEDPAYRKAYSETLLACSLPHRFISACPLAFAETNVRSRIKAVLNYRRPAFWIIAAALAVSLIAAGCTLTDPAKASKEEITVPPEESSTAEPEMTKTPDVPPSSAPESPSGEDESDFAKSQMSYFKRFLTEAEIEEWNAFFEPLIVGHFLATEYLNPENINFPWLLCDGAALPGEAGDDQPVSQEELTLLESRFERWRKGGYAEPIRVRRTDVEALLKKYTGLTIEETNKNGLEEHFDYLPEYDAYYMRKLISAPNRFRIEEGVLKDDRLVALHWVVEHGITLKTGTEGVVYIRKKGFDWCFDSNVIWTPLGNESDSVHLEILAADEKQLTYRIRTDSNCRRIISTGNTGYVQIEKWQDGEWQKLTGNGSSTMEGHVLHADQSYEGTLNLMFAYGGLEEGRYRLLKEYMVLHWLTEEEYRGFTAVTEFTVGAAAQESEEIQDISGLLSVEILASDSESISFTVRLDAACEYTVMTWLTSQTRIQKEQNGEWEDLAYADAYLVPVGTGRLQPGESLSGTLNIKEKYGVLPEGRYRLVQEYGAGNQHHYAFAEFYVEPSLRASALMGEIVSLNNGKPVTEPISFEVDLDGDRKAEKIEVREGQYKDGSMGWELFVDGSEIGYSGSVRNFRAATDLPDEANFPKDAGCRMYLVSLDGKTVSVAIESGTETWVINVEKSVGDFGSILCVKTRLRGEGKSIRDLVPLSTLEAYIDAGWKVRPRNGDMLDFDGWGGKENVYVTNVLTAWLYEERIAVNYPYGNGNGESFSVQHSSSIKYRYDHLYYVKDPSGGYYLRAEITWDGAKTVKEYTVRKQANTSLYDFVER